jgi:hypothetical protein
MQAGHDVIRLQVGAEAALADGLVDGGARRRAYSTSVASPWTCRSRAGMSAGDGG